MTYYLNLRAQPVAGGVGDGRMMQDNNVMQAVDIAKAFRGKNILFVAHGFNVNQQSGMASFARLDARLALNPDTDVFVGVLWPGDAWTPIINYPFEGDDTRLAGNNLA